MRCAVDGWAQQDIHPGDRVAWPTNLGWMMGPWLLYAALLNGATIALYQVGGDLAGKGVKWAVKKLRAAGGMCALC